MIKLNIISPELKNDIKFKTFYTALRSILFLLFISLMVYSVLILTAKYILMAHANETKNRSILITSKTEDYDKQVKDINSQIDYINKIQTNTISWSDFIEVIANNITAGIHISQISADEKTKTFSISGRAETRQDLLNLKESLENLNIFGEINIPIDILLQKENISFSINTKIISYEFKQPTKH